MIGQIAAINGDPSRSGGVMLPNHAPLMVARRKLKGVEAPISRTLSTSAWQRAGGLDTGHSYAVRRPDSDFPAADDDSCPVPGKLICSRARPSENKPSLSLRRAMPEERRAAPRWLPGIAAATQRDKSHAMVRRPDSLPIHFADHDPVDAMCATGISSKPSCRAHKPYAILALRRGLRRQRLPNESGAARLPHRSPISCDDGAAYAVEESGGGNADPYSPAERSLIERKRARLF